MTENTVRDIIAESVKRQIFGGMVGSYSWNVDVDTDEIDEEGEEGYEILAKAIEEGYIEGILGWTSIAWKLAITKDGERCTSYDFDKE